MRKEIVLAIVIGLAVGLILTYGFYLARTALQRDPSNNLNQQALTSPSPDPSGNGVLSVISPVDESVQSSSSVTITGATIVNSFVVIFVNDEEFITTADESGNFSIEAELEDGSNVITVHAIDEDGKQTTVERTVIVVEEAPAATTSATTNEDE